MAIITTPYTPTLTGIVTGQTVQAAHLTVNFNAIKASIDSLVAGVNTLDTALTGISFIPGTFVFEDYGAVGNGLADDTTAIQNCLNAAYAYHTATATAAPTFFVEKKALVTTGGGTYRITQEINFDAAQITFDGRGCTFFCESPTQYNISLTCSYGPANNLFWLGRSFFKHCRIVSVNSVAGSIGIYTGKRVAADLGFGGMFQLQGVQVSGFPGGDVVLGEALPSPADVYILSIDHCRIGGSGTPGIVAAPGANANSGENISVTNSILDAGNPFLEVNYGAQLNSLHFRSVSFDRTGGGKAFEYKGAAQVKFSQCHFEESFDSLDRFIDSSTTTNGVKVSHHQSTILFRPVLVGSTWVSPPDYYIKLPAADHDNDITFHDCNFNINGDILTDNAQPLKAMVEGKTNGKMFFNCKATFTTLAMPRIQGVGLEIDYDGGFEANLPILDRASILLNSGVVPTGAGEQTSTASLGVEVVALPAAAATARAARGIAPLTPTSNFCLRFESKAAAGNRRCGYFLPIDKYRGGKLSGEIWIYQDTATPKTNEWNFFARLVYGARAANGVFRYVTIENMYCQGIENAVNSGSGLTGRYNCFSTNSTGAWSGFSLRDFGFLSGDYFRNIPDAAEMYLLIDVDMTNVSAGDSVLLDDLALYSYF